MGKDLVKGGDAKSYLRLKKAQGELVNLGKTAHLGFAHAAASNIKQAIDEIQNRETARDNNIAISTIRGTANFISRWLENIR